MRTGGIIFLPHKVGNCGKILQGMMKISHCVLDHYSRFVFGIIFSAIIQPKLCPAVDSVSGNNAK
jgi:hypothetical protein